MKVKACPSIDTVRGILQERVTAEREYLVGQSSKLSGLTGDYMTAEKSSLANCIKESELRLHARETELILLQSHTAPRVLVEIDV